MMASNGFFTRKFPTLLLIDADEDRAQRLARILTLINCRPLVATTPIQAFMRFLQEPFPLQGVLLGLIDNKASHYLNRLLQRIQTEKRFQVPILAMPAHIPDEPPLLADSSSPFFHIVSKTTLQVLRGLCTFIPAISPHLKMAEHSLILDLLPNYNLTPRISREGCVRNSYFRQILKAAYELMNEAQWETLMCDVGLAHYRKMAYWPPEDNVQSVPAEYISCLNQAVTFSYLDDPIKQLQRWGKLSTQILLGKEAPSALRQQLNKFLSEGRLMNTMLTAYTRAMNEIRGEELHLWKPLEDDSYWLIHYSNLYAYGRVAPQQSSCHVWLASIETMLSFLSPYRTWEVTEQECSCQTQTGHCLFKIRPGSSHR